LCCATILTVPRQREKLQSRHKVGMKFARLSLNRNNPKIASDPQLRYLFSSRDQPQFDFQCYEKEQ